MLAPLSRISSSFLDLRLPLGVFLGVSLPSIGLGEEIDFAESPTLFIEENEAEDGSKDGAEETLSQETKPTDSNKKKAEPSTTPSTRFRYLRESSSGRHILRWRGKQRPQVGDLIEVKRNEKVLGHFVILKRKGKRLSCSLIGEIGQIGDTEDTPRLEMKLVPKENLAQFTLTDSQTEEQQTGIWPFGNVPKLSQNQGQLLVASTAFSATQNRQLELALSSPVDQVDYLTSFGLRLGAPSWVEPGWLSWFYTGYSFDFAIPSELSIVIGEESQADVTVENRSATHHLMFGSRVPLQLRVIESVSVAFTYLMSSSELTIKNTLLNEEAQGEMKHTQAALSLRSTHRLLANLFSDFFLAQTLAGDYQFTTTSRWLSEKKAETSTFRFGLEPHMLLPLPLGTQHFQMKLGAAVAYARNTTSQYQSLSSDQELTKPDTEDIQFALTLELGWEPTKSNDASESVSPSDGSE